MCALGRIFRRLRHARRDLRHRGLHENGTFRLFVTSESFTIAGVGVGTVTCVTCHPATDLRTVHAASACTACHPNIKTALGDTTTWTGSCTQGTCHDNNSAHPYRATKNNHVSSTPSCISANCHPNGNVAVIH